MLHYSSCSFRPFQRYLPSIIRMNRILSSEGGTPPNREIWWHNLEAFESWEGPFIGSPLIALSATRFSFLIASLVISRRLITTVHTHTHTHIDMTKISRRRLTLPCRLLYPLTLITPLLSVNNEEVPKSIKCLFPERDFLEIICVTRTDILFVGQEGFSVSEWVALVTAILAQPFQCSVVFKALWASVLIILIYSKISTVLFRLGPFGGLLWLYFDPFWPDLSPIFPNPELILLLFWLCNFCIIRCLSATKSIKTDRIMTLTITKISWNSANFA